jgi:hypothetical protein
MNLTYGFIPEKIPEDPTFSHNGFSLKKWYKSKRNPYIWNSDIVYEDGTELSLDKIL